MISEEVATRSLDAFVAISLCHMGRRLSVMCCLFVDLFFFHRILSLERKSIVVIIISLRYVYFSFVMMNNAM